VILGVALSAMADTNGNSIWGKLGNGLKDNFRNIFKSGMPLKVRAVQAGSVIKEHLLTPMKESFKALYATKLGKAIIGVAAIAPILANMRILQLTWEGDKKFVDVTEYIPGFRKNKKD